MIGEYLNIKDLKGSGSLLFKALSCYLPAQSEEDHGRRRLELQMSLLAFEPGTSNSMTRPADGTRLRLLIR
jgi:hypothetical protein